ncbi:MAG: hypothetical protein ACREDV_06915, partial [Methylocella sp.]
MVFAKLDTMKAAALANALGIVLFSLIVMAPWGYADALAEEDIATRIHAKIDQVGAGATNLRESGADVSPFQEGMQQVDQLIRSGKPEEAEKILDTLLAKLGVPPAGSAPIAAAPSTGHICDPRQPMTVNGSVTVVEDCIVGGDLTVTGSAVLHFDYSGRKAGHLVVGGNVIVRDHATIWIQGRSDERAVFAIDNEFSQQRAMTSTDDSTIKLDHVEFRTQKSGGRGKGSVYMNYEARNRSSFTVTGSTLVEEESWLLANLHDSAKLTIADSQHVPTEIYFHDKASAEISGTGTRTGVWLDAVDAKGTLTLPDVNGPFSWRIGAGNGLDAGWSMQVENAQPGLGIEIKPTSELTIKGNGARAPATGELKVSYTVAGSRETLVGLKAGLQNGRISD